MALILKMMTAKEVVLEFWERMRSNDFGFAAEMLTKDYEGFWPQSAELIRGRENFEQINTAYPAKGRWAFDLHSIVVEGDEVVTDVSVTDGELSARVISFSTVRKGLIVKQVEFWPDPMPAAAWRRQWVEIVER